MSQAISEQLKENKKETLLIYEIFRNGKVFDFIEMFNTL